MAGMGESIGDVWGKWNDWSVQRGRIHFWPMKFLTLIAAIVLAALLFCNPSFAQTQPSTPRHPEIRRGIEMPTTDRAQRQELIAEQIARKIEPSLKGDISRLQTYVEF